MFLIAIGGLFYLTILKPFTAMWIQEQLDIRRWKHKARMRALKNDNRIVARNLGLIHIFGFATGYLSTNRYHRIQLLCDGARAANRAQESKQICDMARTLLATRS